MVQYPATSDAKLVRVAASMQPELVALIDEYAKQMRVSRSRIIEIACVVALTDDESAARQLFTRAEATLRQQVGGAP